MKLDCVPAICVEQVVVTCDSVHIIPSVQCVRVQDAVRVAEYLDKFLYILVLKQAPLRCADERLLVES